MKIVTAVGARPQFIKAAVVSRPLSGRCEEILLHTGQHYDAAMSDIFFKELGIPAPKYNLNVGSASHGKQTGEMLIRIEEILLAEKPDLVLVYGDTNSTLAGALAASKLHIPVAHVEAGLRSHNRRMPEEQNRILTDHLSSLLFCPTRTAVEQLGAEGIVKNVYETGDVMLDAARCFLEVAENTEEACGIFARRGIKPGGYRLCTLHRAETTEKGSSSLEKIFDAFEQMDTPVVFPVHPRTKKIAETALKQGGFRNTILTDPVGYLEMLLLTANAVQVFTDSGGLQKEAWIFGTPCITLRPETEWVETLRGDWNILSGQETGEILEKAKRRPDASARAVNPFGDGKAAPRIAEILLTFGAGGV